MKRLIPYFIYIYVKKKELGNRLVVKVMNNNLIRTCPTCGFSFRPFDSQKKKKIKICPMCGYNFIEPNILPEKPEDFDKRYI